MDIHIFIDINKEGAAAWTSIFIDINKEGILLFACSHPSLLISIKRANCMTSIFLDNNKEGAAVWASIFIDIYKEGAAAYRHPIVSIKEGAAAYRHPSFLISIKRALLHGHPSLLISIKMASETFKIWLIYITIPLYSFFTYNGYFIIIIQFIAYICRVSNRV